MIFIRHELADIISKIISDLTYGLLQDHSSILISHTNQRNQLKNSTHLIKVKALLSC